MDDTWMMLVIGPIGFMIFMSHLLAVSTAEIDVATQYSKFWKFLGESMYIYNHIHIFYTFYNHLYSTFYILHSSIFYIL